jgi:hypothetical protein
MGDEGETTRMVLKLDLLISRNVEPFAWLTISS